MSKICYDASVDRMVLDGISMHCGQVLYIGTGDKLKADRLEYDGLWYLVYSGLRGMQLIGLNASFPD